MTHWERTLHIEDVYKSSVPKGGTVTLYELSGIIAERLKKLTPFADDALDEERDEIAYEFEAFSKEKREDVDEFDDIMERLYDWADTAVSGTGLGAHKVCWVKTF